MDKPKYIEKECKHHGLTTYILEGRGAYRCRQCRQNAVTQRRRNVIKVIKDEHGGKCIICGYSRCISALEFHHLDPSQKEFGVNQSGKTVSIDKIRQEAAKCILVCANCHREIESGLIQWPMA